LNPFEINLIRFGNRTNRIGRTVLPTPPISAAPTASPRRTQPLTTRPPSCPGPPVRHVDLVAPTPPSSTVARQHAAAGPLPHRQHFTTLIHATPRAPSLTLSPFRSASTRRPPLRAPSLPLPLKLSHRPIFFFPRTPFVSPVHAHVPRLHSLSLFRSASTPARACCSGPRRPFAPLGWAARLWPSRLFGRPRVAGRRAPWAVASGWFRPSTVRWFLNVFQLFQISEIVSNFKNL
jgi:hypothetical protein